MITGGDCLRFSSLLLYYSIGIPCIISSIHDPISAAASARFNACPLPSSPHEQRTGGRSSARQRVTPHHVRISYVRTQGTVELSVRTWIVK